MRFALPPHVAWPLLVVGFLGMSLTAAGITVVAATSDDGARLVRDYPRSPAEADSLAARRDAAVRLGWRAEVAPAPEGAPAGVTLRILDRAGAPIANLRGTVTLHQPHRAAPVAVLPLQPTEVPGVYHQPFGALTPGRWDFALQVVRDDATGLRPMFTTVLRHDLKP